MSISKTWTHDEILVSVREFVLSTFATARRRNVADTDALIENGIIDSLGILDVVSFLESEFKFTVDDEELVPENFQSISRIATYVESKQTSSR